MPAVPPTPPWPLERYRSLLRLLARQMHTDRQLQRRFDASDVVHDALLRAQLRLGDFRGQSEGEFVKWLQQILHTTFIDKVREQTAAGRTPELEVYLQDVVTSSARLLERLIPPADVLAPPEQLERQEELLRLAEALEHLPPDQREVVVLRRLEGMSVPEIAGRLGRTRKSVAGLLARGQAELGRSMGKES
jgi:RNA polymerase sigma-70 factor (ECF subfamily)